MADAVNSTEAIRKWNEHTIEVEDLAKKLGTTIKKDPTDAKYYGLEEPQALMKFRDIGPNALSEKKELPEIVKFMLKMTGIFNYMLWIGSALCFLAYGIQTDKRDKSNLILGIVLICVILITATMSYFQESKAASLMAQFKNFIPQTCHVYRGGVKAEVNASSLVPGDIVEVNIGDSVPADIVLIKTTEMKVNNASLTGESEDLLRLPEEKHHNIFESPNVAFFGTSCTNGSGVGIVFKTGDATVIGQIANLAQSAEGGDSPIGIEIDKFVKLIGAIAVTMGLFFFAINFAFGYDIATNIGFMIGLIVANVPEGLYITVTVCMALAA